MNKFTLLCGGQRYVDCWEYIDIFRSMNTMTNSIAVKTTDFFKNSPIEWNIKMGNDYIAMINNEVISTGYIDEVRHHNSGRQQNITFKGRDKTADLVDCTYDGSKVQWVKQTALKILNDLCKPFNITVYTDPLVLSKVNTKINEFNANYGDSIMSLIQKAVLDKGVLALSTGDGKLTLTKSASFKFATDVLGANNVISSDLEMSDINRYSKYIVKGYYTGALKFTKAGAFDDGPEGSYTDTVMNAKRYRPYLFFSDSAVDNNEAKERAEYEGRLRAGNSRRLSYTMEGWTEVLSGKVWNVNTLVSVKDQPFNINDTMLISEVHQSYDPEDGFQTVMKLVHKSTYDLEQKIKSFEIKGWF
jgi:prophage tail gpP-like protein